MSCPRLSLDLSLLTSLSSQLKAAGSLTVFPKRFASGFLGLGQCLLVAASLKYSSQDWPGRSKGGSSFLHLERSALPRVTRDRWSHFRASHTFWLTWKLGDNCNQSSGSTDVAQWVN